MRMKTAPAALLLATIALYAAGCGQQQKAETPQTATPATEAAGSDHPTSEAPASEHPTGDATGAEHPASEHPTADSAAAGGEHPK